MSAETSDSSFAADVLESDVPVLVDFWAPWCGPCKMVGPIVDKLAEKAGNTARVLKLNVDNNPEVASKYGITAIPTVLVFKNGQVNKQFVGVQPEATYAGALGL